MLISLLSPPTPNDRTFRHVGLSMHLIDSNPRNSAIAQQDNYPPEVYINTELWEWY
ncbi:hypothetical protein [Burkholderia anthina]|uniref:hypothetical protein n=1 Tax=Burkholderia anthina TaxID=179879 RepID=UPI0015894744|nr:hypothetical protein [Burkholderia anthina]